MKRLLLILAILMITGCKKNLQDFGIVPDDKEPTFDTSPYAQWWGGQLPVEQYGYAYEGAIAYPPKAFAVFWDDFHPADANHGEPWCDPIGSGVIDQFDSEQVGRTTPYAVVNRTDTHFRVEYFPASTNHRSCFTIYSSPN